MTQESITGFNSLSPSLLLSSLHIKTKVAISAKTQRCGSSTSAALMSSQTPLLRWNYFGLLKTKKRKIILNSPESSHYQQNPEAKLQKTLISKDGQQRAVQAAFL